MNIKGKTIGVNNGLKLKNGETYFVVVRATNELGYSYSLRSDGITVQQEQLLPGRVHDGLIPGLSINFQAPTDRLSAHWDYFGLERRKIIGHSGTWTINVRMKLDISTKTLLIMNNSYIRLKLHPCSCNLFIIHC